MKKFVVTLLAGVMALGLVACGGSSDSAAESKVPANTVHSVDDLPGKSIGVQLGTTGDIYAGDIEDATVERYNKGYEAVQALLQDKVDAVMIDSQPANVFVEQNEGIYVIDEAFTYEEYAITVAKEDTELLEEINAAIAKLEESGELQAIIDKYIAAE